MDIVSWTFGNLSYDVDKPVLIDALDPSHSISASQARQYIRQLIAGLKAAGLQSGDTVCILTLSSIYYPIFFLAINGAGGRIAGGNPGHTVYELQQQLSKCDAKFIITEPSLLAKASSAASETGINSGRIYLCNGHDLSTADPRSWANLLQHGECDWEVLDEAEAARTVSAYYSTSGTTGAPKFATVSHAYHIVNGKYIELEARSKPYPVSRLVSLPLMHAFAAPLVHIAALRCGTPTYIMSRFSVDAFVSTISTHAITEFPVVPSMLISLNTSPLCTATALRSVREVMCAGAPLSISTAASFSSNLTAPQARLIQLYGMTEAGWISSTPYRQANNFPHAASTTAPSFPLHASTPTVGVPLPGYELRLLHPSSGLPISGTNTPGALQIRAPHPFMAYLGAEQATRESFSADGLWLKTGDIAVRDELGRYYIVDREKDMIKVRGWQVAPAEIESVLAAHPEVADCAVLGCEDTVGASGEVPWAFVARRRVLDGGSGGHRKQDSGVGFDEEEGAELNEHALKAWVKERLAGYKVPAAIIFVDEIPRGGAGKILRRVLRDKHMKHETEAVKANIPITPGVEENAKATGNIFDPANDVPRQRPLPLPLGKVWPAWLLSNGRDTKLQRWPDSSGAATVAGGSSSRGDRGASMTRWAKVLLLPAGVGLGLCLWRTELLGDARRWWFR